MSAFETPEELFQYLEIHGDTERALTSGKHINQLLELAGHPEGYVESVDPDRWFSFYCEQSAPLIKIARERLANPRPLAKVIQFPVRRRV